MVKIPFTQLSPIALGMGICSAFGGFLYGYDTGYISGVKEMPYWLSVFGDYNEATNSYILSSQTSAVVTAILTLGSLFGALGGYPVGDILGRRWGTILFIVVFAVGVALQTAGENLGIFIAGRVIAGIGIGGTSALLPTYQSECAPRQIRGLLVAAYQWNIAFGQFIAAIAVNGTKDIDGPACYRIPIAIQLIWGALILAGFLVFPESPRWLITKGREEEAQKSLARIFATDVDSPLVAEEYAEIAANLHHERSLGKASFLDCFRNDESRTGFRMWTGIGVQAGGQLAGINFILYYGTTFFQNAGIDNPFTITIAVNLIHVGFTTIGMLLTDRAGRRTLLIIGSIVICVTQLIVAITGTIIGNGNPAGQKVLVAFVCMFVAGFGLSYGPLCWVITSEVYPNAIRSKAMSLSTASNYLCAFGLAWGTPYLVDSGPGNAGLGSKVFFIWSGVCVVLIFYSIFMVPETKGLSLEQIDILYRNSSILKSNSFRKKILSENIHDDTLEAYQQQGKANKGVAHLIEDSGKRDLA